jgi:Arsenite efflux pump ACR3 and related permeases
MKWIDLLCSSAFMMSLALITALATNFTEIFPDSLNADIRADLTVLILAVMMTISLSRIPFRDLDPVTNSKSMMRAIFLGLILSSLIPIVAFYLLDATSYSDQAKGLVFIAATPFAGSVVPLSYILRGDMKHAARGTIAVYLVSLIWIPFLIWIMLGKFVDMTDVIITVIEIIGIPLIISRFITKLKISRAVMSIFMNLCIFFLVWLSVSSTNFSGLGIGILAVFLFIAGLRTFFLGNVIEFAEKKAGIPWSQRVTDVLMASYKNKGIAIAMCVAVMGPLVPKAMVVIAASIVIEICWVVFMDSVLFSKRRMARELETEAQEN